MEPLGLKDELIGNSKRKIPESEIDRVKAGELTVIDVAEKYGVSRQAIYLRKDYRYTSSDIRMRHWLMLFLYRIGLPTNDIAAALGYGRDYVESVLRDKWGVEQKPEMDSIPERMRKRWGVIFLQKLGFSMAETAKMTGYHPMTVSKCRRAFRRKRLQMVYSKAK